jgi:pimeloyl-ACP methyl ester carboxylesterase
MDYQVSITAAFLCLHVSSLLVGLFLIFTFTFFSRGTESAENMAGFVHSLNIPKHVHIIVPDQFGHGMDLERARSQPEKYQHPTQSTLLESTCEFLDVLGVGNNVNCFGISLGGALAYYLRLKRPDMIQRTVLVSPSLEYCVHDGFIKDFVEGKKRHMCFEERNDVKYLFRDLSTGCHNNHKRKRKDPIPKFFLEAIYRKNTQKAPCGHYKGMLQRFIDNIGKYHGNEEHQEMFTAKKDVDTDSPRLVFWPDHDYICAYDKGKSFFSESSNTTFETITDCGHVFHGDGTMILLIDWVNDKIRDYLLDFSSTS